MLSQIIIRMSNEQIIIQMPLLEDCLLFQYKSKLHIKEYDYP